MRDEVERSVSVKREIRFNDKPTEPPSHTLWSLTATTSNVQLNAGHLLNCVEECSFNRDTKWQTINFAYIVAGSITIAASKRSFQVKEIDLHWTEERETPKGIDGGDQEEALYFDDDHAIKRIFTKETVANKFLDLLLNLSPA